MPLAVKRLVVKRGLAPVLLMPAAAFGGRAGIELQRQGHSYLHSLVPWIVLAVASAAGVFLRALGRAFSGQRSPARLSVSFVALWLVCSASLAAIYVCQELLEGLLSTGHPAGLVGVFGYGGWWSVPAAGCVGMVLATLFHGAGWMLREVARRRAEAAAVAAPRTRAAARPHDALIRRLAPLAGGWSGRGPPASM